VQVAVTESHKSRDHTERMLISLGAPVETDQLSVSLSPVDSLAPLDIDVPGDPSSAAYFIALGVLRASGEVHLPDVCLNPTRRGFIDAVIAMGGDVTFVNVAAVAGDSAATVIARSSGLRDISIMGGDVPAMIDELPLLAVVAEAAGITLEVTGAAELRVKESDRIAAIVGNLNAIGGDAEELPDGFRIFGKTRQLAGRVNTGGDHRIAMAFGVLGEIPGNAIDIDDPECVVVSYPDFWSDLRSLRRPGGR
jgi:3-phosphoshikimate 1-carboxyvinyltransferase